MIKIKAPARLHLTLLSMSSELNRRNGGIGFSIDGFDTIITASLSSTMSVTVECEKNKELELEVLHYLKSISNLLSLKANVSVSVLQKPHSHIGLGTGTTLKLSVTEALLKLNDLHISDEEIVKLTKRGGTSGIGINTYFKGGFVFDLGRSYGEIKPSNRHCNENFELPLMLTHVKMPSWEIHVINCNKVKGITPEQEKQFFEKNCNLRKEAVYEATYHSLFGCLASVMSDDKVEFEKSLSKIQSCEWKSAEWALQESQVNRLRELNTPFFLSSLGPTAFSLSEDKEQLANRTR